MEPITTLQAGHTVEASSIRRVNIKLVYRVMFGVKHRFRRVSSKRFGSAEIFAD